MLFIIKLSRRTLCFLRIGIESFCSSLRFLEHEFRGLQKRDWSLPSRGHGCKIAQHSVWLRGERRYTSDV